MTKYFCLVSLVFVRNGRHQQGIDSVGTKEAAIPFIASWTTQTLSACFQGYIVLRSFGLESCLSHFMCKPLNCFGPVFSFTERN